MKGFASYSASHQMQIMGKLCVVVVHLRTTKTPTKSRKEIFFQIKLIDLYLSWKI